MWASSVRSFHRARIHMMLRRIPVARKSTSATGELGTATAPKEANLDPSILSAPRAGATAAAEAEVLSGVSTRSTGTAANLGAPEVTMSRLDTFPRRHLGVHDAARESMLQQIGVRSVDELLTEVVPPSIRMNNLLNLPAARTESAMLEHVSRLAAENELRRTYIGCGYYGTITPSVLVRSMFEDPRWYTPYTPYQAEIAQGRMQSLLNYQTMVSDLTALPISNASLLDEGTAAAEAMSVCFNHGRRKVPRFFASKDTHPQTLAVLETRCKNMGVELVVGNHWDLDFASEKYCGVLVSYPTTNGRIEDYEEFATRAHDNGVLVCAASDLLALTQLKAPGEWGADIAVGSAQRFGVPLGFGGPHAAFFAVREQFMRLIPGRIIGVTRDSNGQPALRLALQPREQHIKRERATSNICTAQALLANLASMYAVYHGPQGLKAIAERTNYFARVFAGAAASTGKVELSHDGPFFDTVAFNVAEGNSVEAVRQRAEELKINIRYFPDGSEHGAFSVSMDETVTRDDLIDLLMLVTGVDEAAARTAVEHERSVIGNTPAAEFFGDQFARTSEYLSHPVFNSHHTEHDMLRYLQRLVSRDYGLQDGMIPLGSCTMKLNAASEMIPVTFPGFSKLHPFVPADQAKGYRTMLDDLDNWLSEVTGFDKVSLQPNSGASGEYTGLLCIKKYHESRGEGHRDVCLIPTSAHGTNPASAALCGYKVVPIKCLEDGNIDLADLESKASKHKNNLAAIMITYPSTHGVFETTIEHCADVVHRNGGQVYMDGANLNAQTGLSQPGKFGMDVCHLNLHKTFCIPHGGGGPGMGPIGVMSHLAPFLPGSVWDEQDGMADESIGMVASSRWGSASILPITYMYLGMMGAEGLKGAASMAIVNANYMVKRLEDHLPILYRGVTGRVAHEFIIDFRDITKATGVTVVDVAKRLMDYGFHAPTMSWPVPGTIMVEPTESESKAELDRFCEALISISKEIDEIAEGRADRINNVLKNAPHTLAEVTASAWPYPYDREMAAFPSVETREHKVWPTVSRVDDVYGDRNVMCTCPDMSTYK